MLVVLSAKKRCGKDTVGDLMEADGFVKYALANPIKRFLDIAVRNDTRLPMFVNLFTMEDWNGFGHDREAGLPISNTDVFRIMKSAFMLYCSDRGIEYTLNHTGRIAEVTLGNKEAWSIRRMMQVFGTDIGCAINKRIWLEYLDDIRKEHENIVVTDCRQDHEVDDMRAIGAQVIHIYRPGYSDSVTDTHSTEKGLTVAPDDHVIMNDSTLEDLTISVTNHLKHLKGN